MASRTVRDRRVSGRELGVGAHPRRRGRCATHAILWLGGPRYCPLRPRPPWLSAFMRACPCLCRCWCLSHCLCMCLILTLFVCGLCVCVVSVSVSLFLLPCEHLRAARQAVKHPGHCAAARARTGGYHARREREHILDRGGRALGCHASQPATVWPVVAAAPQLPVTDTAMHTASQYVRLTHDRVPRASLSPCTSLCACYGSLACLHARVAYGSACP